MNHSDRALENHAEVLPRPTGQYFGTEPNECAERNTLQILEIATTPVAAESGPTTF